MLVLARRRGERILIGDGIEVVVTEIAPKWVKLTIRTESTQFVSKRRGEKVTIVAGVEVTVTEITPRWVKLAIRAPQALTIIRAELLDDDSEPPPAAK